MMNGASRVVCRSARSDNAHLAPVFSDTRFVDGVFYEMIQRRICVCRDPVEDQAEAALAAVDPAAEADSVEEAPAEEASAEEASVEARVREALEAALITDRREARASALARVIIILDRVTITGAEADVWAV